MSDSFLENLPSHERAWYEKLKRRSPAEYEKFKREAQERREVREHVSEKASQFADFQFAFESESSVRDEVKDKIKEGIKDGIDAKVDAKTMQALEKGHFDVGIDKTQSVPRLTVKPVSGKEKGSHTAAEGNIAEALPLKPAFQDKIITSLNLHNK